MDVASKVEEEEGWTSLEEADGTESAFELYHIHSSPILLGRIHLIAIHRALDPIRHLLPAMVPKNNFNPLFSRIMTACGWIIENPTTTTVYQNGQALTCINLTLSKDFTDANTSSHDVSGFSIQELLFLSQHVALTGDIDRLFLDVRSRFATTEHLAPPEILYPGISVNDMVGSGLFLSQSAVQDRSNSAGREALSPWNQISVAELF